MKLILSLLKRTMIELRDIYTKLELDGLLDEKEDSTSMVLIDTESSEREAADNELNDRIEANKANDEAMANVVKWGVYASAMQKMVDEEMAELIRQEFEKAKEEYLKDPTATKEWVTNIDGSTTSPFLDDSSTATIVDFNVTKIGGSNTGVASSYEAFPALNPNVAYRYIFAPNCDSFSLFLALNGNVSDITILGAENASVRGAFVNNVLPKLTVRLVNIKACPYIFTRCYAKTQRLIAPGLESLNNAWDGSIGGNAAVALDVLEIYTPNVLTAKNALPPYSGHNAVNGLKTVRLIGGLYKCWDLRYFYAMAEGTVYYNPFLTRFDFVDLNGEPIREEFTAATTATRAFYKLSVLDQALAFPSLHTGDGMFLNAGMSAANISLVLDSLPSDPVGAGGTGVITFTGCPGAAELTQESESVAAAVAKGWTVEL